MLKPSIIKLPSAAVPFESSRDYACGEYSGNKNIASQYNMTLQNDSDSVEGDAGGYIGMAIVVLAGAVAAT